MGLKKKVRVYFDQGDPANIAFHGQHSIITQRVMEEYLVQLGIDWDEWFMNKDFFFPVLQINTSYKKVVLPGKEYWIDVKIVKVGNSSLSCNYKILTLDKEEVCCEVNAIYVCVDRIPFTSRAIPDHWRKILKAAEEPA